MREMISRADIDNLAELARLKLTDAEAAALQKDISSILEYVGQIASFSAGADTSLPEVRNVMRQDTPRAVDDTFAGKEEALLRALPRREGDYAVVRKIIQKDE